MVRYRYPSKHFVYLQDVFNACLEDVLKTSSAWQFFVFQDVFARLLHDVFKTSWKTKNCLKTCLEDVFQTSWRPKNVSWEVSNESPNDVSVVCIRDVLLVRLWDISCNSQMKHPVRLLWYVSAMSPSYVVVAPCL